MKVILRQETLWVFFFFFGEEMRDFILVDFFFVVFVFAAMDEEKENAFLAHSKLSHKMFFGHGLSTTHIMPRKVLGLSFFSPTEKKISTGSK